MVGSLLDAKTLVAASTQRPNTRVSAIVYKGVLLAKQRTSAASKSSFFANTFGLVKQTAQESLQDKAPQLGAALAYYTVFSLAPLILVLLSLVGVIFRHDAAGAWNKITQQMSYFLDPSAVQVVQSIAQKASQPGKSTIATIIGVALALFGASGVFGQLQDALNTIWHAPSEDTTRIASIRHFMKDRLYGFGLVLGVGFLLFVSLLLNALIAAVGHYFGQYLAVPEAFLQAATSVASFIVTTFLFAAIYKVLPNVPLKWSDVIVGAAFTSFVTRSRKLAPSSQTRIAIGCTMA